jgi:hypothetical protein
MSIAIPEPVNIIYKTIDGVSLSLDVYADSHTGQVKPRPAIVFFHGGGLVSSTSSHPSLWSRSPIEVASVTFSIRCSPRLTRIKGSYWQIKLRQDSILAHLTANGHLTRSLSTAGSYLPT